MSRRSLRMNDGKSNKRNHESEKKGPEGQNITTGHDMRNTCKGDRKEEVNKVDMIMLLNNERNFWVTTLDQPP